MTTTMEQMVIQLQQELFTLKAQVAARVQIASAVQARSLTAAHVRKCAPSLTDTNDMGRPKELILWQGSRSAQHGVRLAAYA